jgi:hypothetical protein
LRSYIDCLHTFIWYQLISTPVYSTSFITTTALIYIN